MKRISQAFSGLLLLMSGFLNAQNQTVTYYKDPNDVPPELTVSLRHVDAALSFVPEEWKVIGKVVLTFIPFTSQTDSIVFFTPGFTFQSVLMNGQVVRFLPVGDRVTVYPDIILEKGKAYQLEMNYQSNPVATGIYFIGWKPEEKGKRKQIWAHRPFGWLPYMESRVTMDIRITFARGFNVFTNGERIEVRENRDGTKTWHYRMKKNHPYFSTALGIGDYEMKSATTSSGVPLELLTYEGMGDRVVTTYQYTKEMFDFFEQEMGMPYPYPIYREIPVIDYMYGGMECTTATIFGDYMLIDPRAYWQRNYINVNAHELAHQWFGDCINHLATKDVWLTESFGTYYAKMFERSVFGEDHYQKLVKEEQLQAFEAAAKNDFPVGGSRGGRERIYYKGSLVLGMFRDVIGEQEFKEVVKSYLKKFSFGAAETQDFIRVVYDVTGKPYQWFFDEWILRGGEPHYLVDYSETEDTSGNRYTRIRVEQIQKTNDLTGLFRMPVWIQVWYSDETGDSSHIWIEDKRQEILIPNPAKKRIAYVLFDPGNHLLKKMTYDKSFQELAIQARNARNMIDRYDALLALRPIPIKDKKELLIICYQTESFMLTKTEILNQLAGDHSQETMEVIEQAYHDKDAEIRKAALMNFSPVPLELRESVESLLQDTSYLNVELALDRLCRDFPSEANRYLEVTQSEAGWRGLNIRMKWLEIAIENGRDSCLSELISYTTPSAEFETRMNAFITLKKLGKIDPEIIENATEASHHWNYKLATSAREYLDYFIQQDQYEKMIHE